MLPPHPARLLLSNASSPASPAPPQDPWGHRTQGWAAQEEVLARKYANVSLRDRVPQAMWRGRTRDERYPARDELRWVRWLL